MRARYLLLIPCLAASVAFAADASFDRTLNTSGPLQLSVATGSGYIHLRPGSDVRVHIIGHVRANRGWLGFDSDVDSRIKQIAANPSISQNGNDISIGESHSIDLYRNISIDYDITLPRAASIMAATGSGEINIQDVGNGVRAVAGSGSVQIRGMQGAAELHTGSGSIDLQKTGPGDVRARTGSGSIHLDGIYGALDAGTGSGSIDVEGKPTTTWKLGTGSGSIHLNIGRTTPFTVRASTISGGVQIEQPISTQGNLDRRHITAAANGGGPSIEAHTTSGNIHIE